MRITKSQFKENKMRITKSQLQQVIREALDEEMEDRISGKDMLAIYDKEQGLDVMSKEEAMEELENILRDIRKTSNDDRSSQQANRAEDMLRVIARGGPASAADMERYESDYRDPPREPLKGKSGRPLSGAEMDKLARDI